MRTTDPLLVGAGLAGICPSEILSRTDLDVSADLFERLPAPFGHPRELVPSAAEAAVVRAIPGNVVAA